jgi:hypothetical protein
MGGSDGAGSAKTAADDATDAAKDAAEGNPPL